MNIVLFHPGVQDGAFPGSLGMTVGLPAPSVTGTAVITVSALGITANLPVAVATGGGGSDLLLDHFSDTDLTLLELHTMDVGAGWTSKSGIMKITSNRAQDTSLVGGLGLYTAEASQANVTVSAICQVPSAGVGIVARCSDTNNFWLLYMSSAGNSYMLYEVNGGTYTSRASASVTVGANTDHTLSMSLSGTTINATFDGANGINYGSASNNQTVTKHGLYAEVVNSKYDDFKVDSP